MCKLDLDKLKIEKIFPFQNLLLKICPLSSEAETYRQQPCESICQ